MNEYEQRLYNIGVIILGEFINARTHTLLKCRACSHEWTATPISKLQNHKKHGLNGCPACNTVVRDHIKAEKRTAFLAKLPPHIKIVSDYNGTQDYLTTRSVTFENELCGHTFSTNPNYVINGKTECTTCGEAVRKAKLLQRNDKRALALDERHDWTAYKSKVARYTRLTYLKHKQTLNPNNLLIAWAGVEGAYHVDHIVPKRVGFELGICPELLSHVDNLQLLPWRENLAFKAKIKDIPVVFSDFVQLIENHTVNMENEIYI